MDKNDVNVGSGLVGAPACGDGKLSLAVCALLDRYQILTLSLVILLSPHHLPATFTISLKTTLLFTSLYGHIST